MQNLVRMPVVRVFPPAGKVRIGKIPPHFLISTIYAPPHQTPSSSAVQPARPILSVVAVPPRKPSPRHACPPMHLSPVRSVETQTRPNRKYIPRYRLLDLLTILAAPRELQKTGNLVFSVLIIITYFLLLPVNEWIFRTGEQRASFCTLHVNIGNNASREGL